MPTPAPARRSLVRPIATALLLGGAARLAVLRAPELADGVFLRLDEAFSLFTAIAIGPHWGAVTSLVATLGTPEPSTSAIWALEAWLVGLIVRLGVTPVLAAVGYWLLICTVYVVGLVPMPDFGVDPRLLLAKQLINGTLCAAFAKVAASSAWVTQALGGAGASTAATTLRQQYARALVPVSTIPVILLSLGLGRMYATNLVREGTADLETRANTVVGRLSDHVSSSERDVSTIGASLSGAHRTPDEIRRILQLHHAGTVLSTMIVTDANGQVVAVSTREGGPVPASVIPPVADRQYFLEPQRTGRTYRSNGFEGRGFTSPTGPRILAVSAPYIDAEGRFAGVVQGTVSLVALSAWLERVTAAPGESALVLDAARQVVASAGIHTATLLADGGSLPWVQATARETTSVFVDARTNGPRPERSVSVRREVPGLAWEVHVRRSIASMQTPLVPFYLLSAGWLVLCVAIATLLASRVSRHITRPLEALARTAEAVGRGQERPSASLPPSAPAEVQSLHRSLDAMVRRLDESMSQLDQKVRARSAELAAAAAQHDTIFSVANDGMLILDADRRILEVNDAFCRMVAFGRDELVTSEFSRFEPAVADEARTARRNAVQQQGFVRFEAEFLTRDARRVPVEVVATAIPGSGGRILLNVRDISERRHAEAARAELEARLRQSQKLEAIGTLAGGIAHDFNNILTMIAGNAELASLDLPADHPARQNLEHIGRATSRAEALIRQILTFSRRRDEQLEVVDVNAIVREAVEMLRSMLPAMIAIETAIDEALPHVHGEAVQLQQVLINLGVNAGHAMQARGGVLSVAVRRASGGAGNDAPGLQLTIGDTGTGMDEQTVERVFEPFFTTKPAGEGTGLGLAVVHGIVTAHGGTIAVASTPGHGTTFTIWLPAAGVLPHPEAPPPAPPAAAGTRARVLVVDDEPELVTLVCRQLDRLGYVTTGCAGPTEALAQVAAAAEPFDVVLSDLAMPTMTGIELGRHIREHHPNTAVVLYSGRVTEDDGQLARAAGIVEILGKPFTRGQLADALARALASSARTRGTTSVP